MLWAVSLEPSSWASLGTCLGNCKKESQFKEKTQNCWVLCFCCCCCCFSLSLCTDLLCVSGEAAPGGPAAAAGTAGPPGQPAGRAAGGVDLHRPLHAHRLTGGGAPRAWQSQHHPRKARPREAHLFLCLFLTFTWPLHDLESTLFESQSAFVLFCLKKKVCYYYLCRSSYFNLACVLGKSSGSWGPSKHAGSDPEVFGLWPVMASYGQLWPLWLACS